MVELSKIAAISGQGGLFRVHSPLKNGVVMESLDEKKTKQVAGPSSKVSVLSEISIYTTSSEGAVPLSEVLKKLHTKYGAALPVTPKSDGADLKAVLLSVLPDADTERVYASDIKKLVSWYQILVIQIPEIFTSEEAKEETPAESAAATETEKPAAKAKKPARKKAEKES